MVSPSSIRLNLCFLWALEGLFHRGRTQWALDLLRTRFDWVRNQGLSTVPEIWNLLGERFTGRWRSRDSRSAAQGPGVIGASLLSRYVLGIRPLRPGFEEVLLAPQPADLTWAEGAWHCPKGAIHVSWRFDETGIFTLHATLPAGISGIIRTPEGMGAQAQVKVNGKPLQPAPNGEFPFALHS